MLTRGKSKSRKPCHEMVILRPTQKLRALLPLTAPASADFDSALGDWYINRIVVDRCPLLLIVSAKSLLTLLIPARDVRTIPNRLAMLVATRLRRLGIAQHLIECETSAMTTIAIAPTRDRSVLGVLVDTAKTVPSLAEIQFELLKAIVTRWPFRPPHLKLLI